MTVVTWSRSGTKTRPTCYRDNKFTPLSFSACSLPKKVFNITARLRDTNELFGNKTLTLSLFLQCYGPIETRLLNTRDRLAVEPNIPPDFYNFMRIQYSKYKIINNYHFYSNNFHNEKNKIFSLNKSYFDKSILRASVHSWIR